MDKKMIEEMAKDIVRSAGLDVYGKAEYLYNAGYRKIPENAVVLTREEQDKLYSRGYNDGKEFAEKFYKPLVKAETRKETSEKFAEKGKTVLVKAYDQYVANADRNEKAGVRDMWSYWNGEANATQKSIELMDEICKEITEGKDG